MAQHDQHITTEQLSAFLDSSLSSDERTLCDGHLKRCELCQQKLADLRQTVALLRALPQPVLPRSFVLPADMALTPEVTRKAEQPLTLTRVSKPRRWSASVRYTIRTMSALAAVMGIVFLLSGFLTMEGNTTANMAAPASSFAGSDQAGKATLPQSQTQTSGLQTPSVTTTVPQSPTRVPALRETPSAANVKPHDQKIADTPQPAPSISPITFLFEISTSAQREGIGLLLLLLAMTGFFWPMRQRKHQEDRT